MSAILNVDRPHATTDGEIAAINLESARRRAWARFAQDPRLPGAAEAVIANERLAAQFLGDLSAFDRMETLAAEFALVDGSFRAALIQAEVASGVHRFAEARWHLARAELMGAPHDELERHVLAIDQACGAKVDTVLEVRRRIARAGRLEDLVPLAAVLADLERFAEADDLYREAIHAYDGISPFPPAWACFQLGMLWGELVPEPDPYVAALWYRRAIDYLPGYVKARVHLAEVYAGRGQLGEAEALLLPAVSSGDPEVRWRLADVLFAQKRFDEAEIQLELARIGFEELLQQHFLAFADHGAEFYAGSGNDLRRAMELARANAANRATRGATDQVDAIAAKMVVAAIRAATA